MTAGLLGSWRAERAAPQSAASNALSSSSDASRTSSSQTNLAPAASTASTMSSRLGLLDEGARRNDRPDERRADRGGDVRRPRRVVDHRRDAPARQQAEQRHGDAVGVRQQHADRLARSAHRFEALAEDARAGEQLAVAERAAHHVLDDRMRRPEQPAPHRASPGTGCGCASSAPRRAPRRDGRTARWPHVVRPSSAPSASPDERHRLELPPRRDCGNRRARRLCRAACSRTADSARRR